MWRRPPPRAACRRIARPIRHRRPAWKRLKTLWPLPAPGSPQLEAERDDFKDRWLRSEAEIANVRARAKREVDETRQYAVQKFARDVVEAAENLKRGLDSLPPAAPDEPEIVTSCATGSRAWNAASSACWSATASAAKTRPARCSTPICTRRWPSRRVRDHPPGTVLQAWTNGWTLNGRLLRPAMVVVAKAPASASAGTSGHPQGVAAGRGSIRPLKH